MKVTESHHVWEERADHLDSTAPVALLISCFCIFCALV
jgi:hypothetical protein